MKKIALITGGGSGIGQALAWNLAGQGISSYIIGRRESALLRTSEKFPSLIHSIVADIATESGRNKIATALVGINQILYLVHCAGTVEPVMPLQSISRNDFKSIMATNVEGPLFLTQRFISKLKNGRVLNISSFLAHNPAPSMGGYCISKAALYMTKEVFNVELAPNHILFGSIMPGIVDTQMQDRLQTVKADDFPGQDYYIKAKKAGAMISPTVCAKFLSYILLKTPANSFTEGDWDIYEKKHHHHWLGSDELPLPL